MKIVIIGSVIFSKNLIDDVLKNKFDIKGIIGKKNNRFNSVDFDMLNILKKKELIVPIVKILIIKEHTIGLKKLILI